MQGSEPSHASVLHCCENTGFCRLQRNDPGSEHYRWGKGGADLNMWGTVKNPAQWLKPGRIVIYVLVTGIGRPYNRSV